jgi:arylsulfatase A-like enzyme
MNLIVIIADTTRADYLGCYGSDWVKTPNLDALAREGVLFENCYADGLPTIPERRVFFTGKSIIPMSVHGGWKKLEPEDITIAEIARSRGCTTAFITDTYHYFRPGLANFHRGFDSWEFIRGQEGDPWKSGPRDAFDPRKHMPEHLWNEVYDEKMRQYMMNTQDVRSEDDYFCARTFRRAMTWLERNRDSRPFLLWVDTFDPHEPWDAPERFRLMYRDDYPFERYLFGYGVRREDVREEDYPILRALYAAEISFVDMWIGRLRERLDDLGLLDDTAIVFSTDHGTHLGEEGCIQKTPGLLNSCVARLPMIVRHPDTGHAGKRIAPPVSSIDYVPTFLHFLEIEPDAEYTREAEFHRGLDGKLQGRLQFDGENLWDLVTGKRESLHERVFSEFGNFAAVRDTKWHYFQHMTGDDPGKGPCLYDLTADPGEKENVVDKHPDVAAEMRTHLEHRLGVRP